MLNNKFTERWKPVVGYEDNYIISTYGRIVRLPYIRKNTLCSTDSHYITKLCSQDLSRQYPSVVLYKDSVRKRHSIHRLMGVAFIPNPENKPCINHIDGNKDNNNIINIEWVTYSENTLHSFKNGLQIHPMIGKHHSIETRRKMRESWVKRKARENAEI